jgi:antitoxin (DNA-binding transcriptional repressor) of toxin-antitoxin stability system
MVEAGATVIICKRNVPVAEIRPIVQKKKKKPQLGWADGEFIVPEDFNHMSGEEAAEWEGDKDDPLRKYAPRRAKAKK